MCKMCDLREEIIELLQRKTKNQSEGYHVLTDVFGHLAAENNWLISDKLLADVNACLEHFKKLLKDFEGGTLQ